MFCLVATLGLVLAALVATFFMGPWMVIPAAVILVAGMTAFSLGAP